MTADVGEYTDSEAIRRGHRLIRCVTSSISRAVPVGADVVDIGSGAYGDYVNWMRCNGWPNAVGIDGSASSCELSGGIVLVGDVTNASECLRLLGMRPEWIICTEVGEHVPITHQSGLIETLSLATDGIMLSWATPGQRGRRHINCRLPEWVACEMGRVGFALDHDETMALRDTATRHWNKKLMVFRRATACDLSKS